MLRPGQLFAERYRIERFLARGGYGAVFAAEQTNTESPVAVKVLWPHLVDSGDVAERFKLEARVAGRIRSDHIVRVFDTGYDKETGLAFLVMELLTGVSLQGLIEKDGPLDGQTVARYLMQVASGLDKAHGYVDKQGNARPIVHRDLKPENLFLTHRDNGEPLVKVLDFGIAKVTTTIAGTSQGIKGTPLYMSYEQVASEPVTPATDVWALALIAFFLLTGKSYWRCAADKEINVATLFSEVLQGDLDAPSERCRALGITPTWSEAFDRWFLRCVDRDAEARYQRVSEAAQGLAEALLGIGWAATLPQDTPPSISTPDNHVPSGRPSSKSGPGDALSSAARSESRLALSRTEPEDAARRPRRWLVVAAGLALVVGAALSLRSLTTETPRAETLPGSSAETVATASTGKEPTPIESAAPAAPGARETSDADAMAPSAASAEATPTPKAHPAAAEPPHPTRPKATHATVVSKPAPKPSSTASKSPYSEW